MLALVKSQHHSTVELARLRVLREEDRIVDYQLGKFLDDHLHEAPVVAVGSRGTPVHSEGAMSFFVERHDLRHGAPSLVKRVATRSGSNRLQPVLVDLMQQLAVL